MVVLANPDECEAWADLAARYHWLYGRSLQQRLANQGDDVAAWWAIGGTADAAIRVPVAARDEWLDGRPEKVRDVIIKVALERRVPVMRIMGGQHLRHVVEARHEAVRRLAALPWRGSYRGCGHPSPQQIAQWMNMERSTVARLLGERGAGA